MSKKTILIIIVFILAATAWYFYEQKSQLLKSQDFIVNDVSLIDKIIIDKAGRNLKLEKLEDRWMVNDTFQANHALVRRFLRVFKNLDLVAPISGKAKDTVLGALLQNGTEVKVFTDNSLGKEYLFGHLNASGSGNIVLLDGEKLAIVNSIGLKDLNSIVSAKSMYWRNKQVFNKNASKIVRLVHKNMLYPDKSYTIISQNGKLTVLDYKNKPLEDINNIAVERYLSYFQNIGFEQLEHSLNAGQRDSILKHNLAHSIILVDDSNISYKLNLYLKPEVISKNRMGKAFDLNRIYGKINYEDNILIFEYYIIDPILKDVDYFVQKIK